MNNDQELAAHEKKLMTGANLFWLGINGGLAYWIGKNYWKKSGWGKFGTLYFGTSAAANVASAAGIMATPTELIKKAMNKDKDNTNPNFIGPMPPK